MTRRPSVTDRLPAVVGAAVQVFADKGYKATQMADVAAALGMGAGSLYNYVETKEVLFALCLEHLMHQGPPDQMTLPLAAPALDLTLQRLREHAERALQLPMLSAAALGTGPPGGAEAELAAVVTELYELLSRTRQLSDMIERSARDIPALAWIFLHECRDPLLTRVETYLESRIDAGQLRPVADNRIAARFVVETVGWFARHRFHDPDARGLDESATKATVVDLIVAAFLPREQPR